MELVRLNIDGQDVEVPAGISVLEAAERIGIEIPHLCYDPELSAVGACRLCVVEIEGMRSLPASCVTTVGQGMVVQTNTPAVQEARKTILELLIADHHLDCYNCEKAGDCTLARYCLMYGPETWQRKAFRTALARYGFKDQAKSPLEGESHSYDLEDDNPFIVRDLNRCILCGKCIRACAEITHKNILDFAYRGFNTKVAPFGDTALSESDCVFCGNCLAFCPTGALLEKQMIGHGRRWEWKKVKTTCPFCSTGCTFDLCVKDGEVIGVTSNPDNEVNGSALCIKGRFGTRDYIHNEKRLKTPLIKRQNGLKPASWGEALDLTAGRLNEVKEKYGPEAIGVIISGRCTNEEIYLMQKLARAALGTNNVDHYPNDCHNAHYCDENLWGEDVDQTTGLIQPRCPNNIHGADDMGAQTNLLTGYQQIGDEEVRLKFAGVWQTGIPEQTGLTIAEMFDRANWGDLKAMLILGENPVLVDKKKDWVCSGLEKLEFLAVMDLVPTETSAYADIVLPASSFAETDGTFTNNKRRLQRVRQAIAPLAGRQTWQTIVDLSNRLGYQMDYDNPEQIFEEIVSLTPILSDFSYQGLDRRGLVWPQ